MEQRPTRIAAAFIVSGDRLISRIPDSCKCNSIVPSLVIMEFLMLITSQFVIRKLIETSFTPFIQYLARVNTDAHIKAVV